MAQPHDLIADSPVAAVVEIDAEHTDQPAVLLDEHGVGPQVLPVDGDPVIVQAVIGGLVALIPQDAQRHIGQGSADLPAADMVVGDGDDGAVFVRQIVERDLVIRTQSLSEKFGQLYIVLQERVGHVRHMHTSFHDFVLWNLYHYI